MEQLESHSELLARLLAEASQLDNARAAEEAARLERVAAADLSEDPSRSVLHTGQGDEWGPISVRGSDFMLEEGSLLLAPAAVLPFAAHEISVELFSDRPEGEAVWRVSVPKQALQSAEDGLALVDPITGALLYDAELVSLPGLDEKPDLAVPDDTSNGPADAPPKDAAAEPEESTLAGSAFVAAEKSTTETFDGSPKRDEQTEASDTESNFDEQKHRSGSENQLAEALAVSAMTYADLAPAQSREVQEENEAPSGLALELGPNGLTEGDGGMQGRDLGRVIVEDPNSGDSHTVTVDDPRFEVVAGRLRLRPGETLDHETEPAVTLSLTATDVGGLAVTRAITLAVEDMNDAPEGIVLDLSAESLAEGITGQDGLDLGAVTVADPDLDDTHAVTVDDARFEVVEGHLRLRSGATLDHETEPEITLSLTATDEGGLAVTRDFTLAVQDLNEAPEGIALDLQPGALDEGSAGDSRRDLGPILVDDPDTGDTHTVTVDDARFEIVEGHLRLRPGETLDHETEPEIALNLTATDAGGETFTQELKLSVGDVNEAPEGIALDLSGGALTEGAGGADGRDLGAVEVSDPDGNDTHTVVVDDPRFEVSEGRLRLRPGEALDHETEPELKLSLTATDDGGLSTSQEVTLAVSDVNEAPQGLELTALSLPEDDLVMWFDAKDLNGDHAPDSTGPGKTLVDKSGAGNHATLSGTAPDQAEAGMDFSDTSAGYKMHSSASIGRGTFPEKSFAFEFETGDDVSGVQMIYEQGGTVRGYSLSIAPDPETGEPRLWGLAYNRSEWDAGHKVKAIDLGAAEPGRSYSVALVHDATAADSEARTFTGYVDGAPVAQATHVDIQYNHPDAAGLGNLTHGTVLPHTGQPFRGDIPFKGMIAEARSWNTALEDSEVAALEALRSDAISQGENGISVLESIPGGTAIAALEGVDPDAGDTLNFQLVDGEGVPVYDPLFEIVGGQIRLRPDAALDHETAQSHDLRIEVSDDAGLTHIEDVTIRVGNVDEAPEDIEFEAETVKDDAEGGAIIGLLSADDPEDGAISFAIVGDADRIIEHPLFEIVGDTLRLRPGASLDADAQDSHSLRIQAVDAGGNVTHETISFDVIEAPELLEMAVKTGFRAEYQDCEADLEALDRIDWSTAPDHVAILDDLGSGRDGSETVTGPEEGASQAVRITGRVDAAEGGEYTFHVVAGDDAGARLIINGQEVAASTDAEGGLTVELDSGANDIELTYLDTGAGATLEWEGPGLSGRQPVDAADPLAVSANDMLPLSFEFGSMGQGGFEAEYFDLDQTLRRLSDIDWDAPPDHTETVEQIDYTNSHDSFWEGGDTDTFATRICGPIEVEEGGSYKFFVGADDGVVLYVNGEEVVDNDGLHGFRTRTGEIELEPGTHEIEVRYFENYGRAGLKLEWEGPGTDGRSLVEPAAPQIDPDDSSQTMEIIGLPPGTLLIVGDEAALTEGGAVDVTGWPLDAVELAPPAQFCGQINLTVRSTRIGQDGEAEIAESAPVEIVVEPPEGMGDLAQNTIDPLLEEALGSGNSGSDSAYGSDEDDQNEEDASDDVLSEPVALMGDAEFVPDQSEICDRPDW